MKMPKQGQEWPLPYEGADADRAVLSAGHGRPIHVVLVRRLREVRNPLVSHGRRLQGKARRTDRNTWGKTRNTERNA